MKKRQNAPLNTLMKDRDIFFRFMKNNYPVFYNSNLFLRDIQYSIKMFFHYKGIELGYTQAEKLAKDFGNSLEKEEKLIKNGINSWKMNFLPESGVTLNEQQNILTETT